MGGNKRRRRNKEKEAVDGSHDAGDDNNGTKKEQIDDDGVEVHLESVVAHASTSSSSEQDYGGSKDHIIVGGNNIIPSSWSIGYVQSIKKESPSNNNNNDFIIPSVHDVGLQMVRGTLERISNRNNTSSNNKKKKKKLTDDLAVAVKPTAIQLRLWPALLDSFDKRTKKLNGNNAASALNVVGIAPTGTGKTMSYCIPIISNCVRTLLASSSKQKTSTAMNTNKHTYVHAIILVPTRELAIQVSKESKVVAKVANKYLSKCGGGGDDASRTYNMKVETMAVYGGMDIESQISSLLGKGDKYDDDDSSTLCYRSLVVAATAGRLLDILKQHSNNGKSSIEKQSAEMLLSTFANLQAIVFDEADRIAVNVDMAGQVDEILAILKDARVKANNNNHDLVSCLVSATLPEKAKEMCEKWVPRSRIVVKVDSVKVGGRTLGEEKQGSDDTTTKTGIDNKNSETSAKDPSSEMLADEGTNDDDDGKLKKKKKHLLQNLDLASIPSNIVQTLHVCSNHKKPKKLITTLQRIYLNKQPKSASNNNGRFSVNNRLCIVFFGQIKTVKYVSKLLVKEGLRCVELYGSLNQSEREKRLLDFKAGKRPILLATDVAARGLHIPNVHFVVNYDFPGSLDQYVHRCGRAGRKQALSGEVSKEYPPTVYSFFTRELAAMADSVIELLKSCNAWVDPNLLALSKDSNESSGEGTSKKSGRKRKRKSNLANALSENKTEESEQNNMADDDGSDNDQFAFLGGSVLKRASHVSDAEDSDEE